MVTCSLGDDGVPSYEDTCSFTCNTGYELTGNDTRTCQSDGSWSGSNAVCTRGKFHMNLILCVRELPVCIIDIVMLPSGLKDYAVQLNAQNFTKCFTVRIIAIKALN